MKMFKCTAQQLMTHMMKVHPVENPLLASSRKGQAILGFNLSPGKPVSPQTGSKRPFISPDIPSSKRRQTDSGVTDTPSTVPSSASPRMRMSSGSAVGLPMSKDQMENLTRGIEEGFIYRIWNTFRGLRRDQIIRNLRRGPLHPTDTNTLIWEAEDREVRVSDLIEAILGIYIFK